MEFTSMILPIFCIVFFPSLATKLKIPAYISKLKRYLTIKDKHNNTWPVEARKDGDDWYLLDGWAKFVTDSSVSTLDVLSFRFSSPGTLDVTISGPNGEIKEGVGYHRIGNNKEHHKRKRHESEPSYNVSDSSYWSGDSWMEITNEELESNFNDPEDSKKGKSIARDVKRAKGMKSIKHEIGTNKEHQKRKRHESEPSYNVSDSSYWSGDSWMEITNEELESNFNDPEDSKKGKSIARDVKRAKGMKSIKPIGYLEDKLFESGVPRPTGKYFVTQIKPGRMQDLLIPKDLVDDENLKLPEIIKLVDPDGNTYSSLLAEWPSDKRKLYKKGMGKLCKKNSLTGDDYAICQFGEGFYDGYIFVHILRRVVRE